MTIDSVSTYLSVILVASVGALIGIAWPDDAILAATSRRASSGETISGCHVTDGDTIRCGRERVRLLGIDAPELPGHCSPGRHCVTGDPFASSNSLSAAMRGSLRIERVGNDRYGRTLALVTGPRGDLSCWQLSHRQAIYRYDWDNGGLLAARCSAAR